MENDDELSSDIKHDIKLGFDLFKNEKNEINKLKLRTLLFSFVMYKSSASDINQFIEEQTNEDQETFTYDEVCNMVKYKLRNSKEKEADEVFSYLTIGKNDTMNITDKDIAKAFKTYSIGASDEEIREMMKYMTENEDQANQTSSTGNGKVKANRAQFKKFYVERD